MIVILVGRSKPPEGGTVVERVGRSAPVVLFEQRVAHRLQHRLAFALVVEAARELQRADHRACDQGRLRRVGAGRYVGERAVPVGGNWKSMLRLARGSHLMGLPVFLPPSPQSGRPGVPVAPRSGVLTSDTFLLQREATGGPAWLQTAAYAVLAAIVAVWLALVAWALGLAEPRDGARVRGTLRRPWPPPAAPA